MNLALFDLDGTLIPGDSDHAFGEFMIDLGWVDEGAWRERNNAFFADYQRGALDLPRYIEFTTSAWRSRTAAEQDVARQQFIAQRIRPQILPPALALIEKHRAAGDLIAVVTATNEFVTAPIVAALEIEHLLAVRLVRTPQGGWTGQIDGTPTYQAGKTVRVTEWLQAQGRDWADFGQTWFYSDSINDVPLLERVSHPVATNPSDALRRLALERGWPVLDLFDDAQRAAADPRQAAAAGAATPTAGAQA
ncbi:HAD family hydrolase [Amphibiibacter pelophylacis]|uniref:HAD-IB family hydrolase n=1 Tax=Amphibiibacter pelophylacis TaxID=1799477 RepID=A0ACC6P4Q2_9BURK